MYNAIPNYNKMGLYDNNKNTDPIYVYFDDFDYVLYEPVKAAAE